MKTLSALEELLISVSVIGAGNRIVKSEIKMLGYLGTNFQELYVSEHIIELMLDIKEKTPKKTFFQKLHSKFKKIIKGLNPCR